MSLSMSREARRVLRRGTFCSIAARADGRLHLTPVVFVLDGDSLWLTTARSSVKARAWREDPRTAGVVEHQGKALSFRGRVRMFDLLDPGTWAASAARSPVITRAAARFSLKNARFFAGYARDAHRLPLSWTPPARVFASVEMDSAALLDVTSGAVVERWGEWPSRSSDVVRTDLQARGRGDPLAGLPEDIAVAVGRSGEGAVAVGRAVLPCAWRAENGGLFAEVAPQHLVLAGRSPDGPAALAGQRASAWRAREMRGFLAQGDARADGPAVRLRLERLVWWHGWSAGTVGR
ncbi:MAG: pyridoxamine 5'-phosphate oxidase family protein [Actinobacteria bacterium]|nr:pyridoxamine 5'-phosphate oxidase family protein [Actinomycetota bacterium]